MNRNLIFFAAILLVLIGAAYFALSFGKDGKTAVVNGNTIKLEIADTDPLRTKGLSGRDSLANDSGMLFQFDTPGIYSFWMKDMKFPIDIIFLQDTKVVTIYDSVQPFFLENGVKRPNLTLYPATATSGRVLELNAGLAKKYKLKVGETIKLNL
jgi:uncharacterized membrane protein (UPF0127 family)